MGLRENLMKISLVEVQSRRKHLQFYASRAWTWKNVNDSDLAYFRKFTLIQIVFTNFDGVEEKN